MNLKKINIILGTVIALGLIVITLQSYKVFPFHEAGVREAESDYEYTLENIERSGPERVARKASFNSYLKKGDSLFAKGFHELAINEYIKANEEQTDAIEPFIRIGQIHLELKNNGKARKNFETALQIDNTNLSAIIGLGKTYIGERDIEEAKKIFEPLHQEDARVKYYKGIIFAYLGDYEKSKENLIDGATLKATEKIKKNIEIFNEAYDEFRRNKGGVEVHLQTLLAKAFSDVEEYQIAIPLLQNVLKEKNNYVDAWTIMGYSYLKLGRSQDAIEALSKAKSLAPEKPENLFLLGLGYFSNDQLDEAAEHLNAALENGYQPEIIIKQKLAEIYVLQGKYEDASKAYEDLISLNNNDINAFIRPIWLNIDKINNKSKALDLALSSLETHPDNAMAHNLVGWAYLSNQNLRTAKLHLIEAIQIDDQFDAAYYNLGQVYEKKNKLDTALKLYKKAEQIRRDPSITLLAQKSYHKAKIRQQNQNGNLKASVLESP